MSQEENNPRHGKARVLHVIEALHPGGAERIVAGIARGLDRHRFEVGICCLRDGGVLAQELEAEGIPVTVLAKRKRADWRLLRTLHRLIRRRSIDIVHTHVFTANLWGRLAAGLARVPVVLSHEHSFFTLENRQRLRLEGYLYKLTDCVVTVSASLRACYLACVGAPPERVAVIHNGITIKSSTGNGMPEPQLAKQCAPFRPLLGSVGRLDARKNFSMLLQACVPVFHRFPQAGLLLIGDGEQRQALQSMAAALGIASRVVFAGTRMQVASLLPLMDLFCLPSRTEGISIALLEAMAAGVPVVATCVGGTPEVIPDSRFGWLVPPYQVDALAAALCTALAEPGEARARAALARKRVLSCFSHEMMLQTLESLYSRLLARKSHGRNRLDVPQYQPAQAKN